MNRHLVMYFGRTGSTLIDNHISRNICQPKFLFGEHGFDSSEIHADEILVYYKKIKKMNDAGVKDWCMKYHIHSGVGWEGAPNFKYKFWLEGSEIFFKDLGVTNLHFSFRLDIMDTIASHMIATRDNTWVVTDGEVIKHKRRYYELDFMKEMCHAYNKSYQLYNEYIKLYKDKQYDITYYPYEKLHNFLDTDKDPRGMVKQLTKEEKKELIINYDEFEKIAKDFPFYHGKINENTGVLEI